MPLVAPHLARSPPPSAVSTGSTTPAGKWRLWCDRRDPPPSALSSPPQGFGRILFTVGMAKCSIPLPTPALPPLLTASSRTYLSVYILGRYPEHFWCPSPPLPPIPRQHPPQWQDVARGAVCARISVPVSAVAQQGAGRLLPRALLGGGCGVHAVRRRADGCAHRRVGSLAGRRHAHALCAEQRCGARRPSPHAAAPQPPPGPLALATVLLANALVPHSFDHMGSLLIHLQPMMTSFTVRWIAPLALFPVESVSFVEYARPPLICIGLWTVAHAAVMLSYGLKNFQRCSYFDQCGEVNGKRRSLDWVLGQRGGARPPTPSSLHAARLRSLPHQTGAARRSATSNTTSCTPRRFPP